MIERGSKRCIMRDLRRYRVLRSRWDYINEFVIGLRTSKRPSFKGAPLPASPHPPAGCDNIMIVCLSARCIYNTEPSIAALQMPSRSITLMKRL